MRLLQITFPVPTAPSRRRRVTDGCDSRVGTGDRRMKGRGGEHTHDPADQDSPPGVRTCSQAINRHPPLWTFAPWPRLLLFAPSFSPTSSLPFGQSVPCLSTCANMRFQGFATQLASTLILLVQHALSALFALVPALPRVG